MSEHIVQPRIYVTIFLALMVGTTLTVVAAYYDFPGPLNAVVALTIASIKATLVVLFFMHVRYSGRLIWLVIVAALLWLAIMFAVTLSDYWTRAWLVHGSVDGKVASELKVTKLSEMVERTATYKLTIRRGEQPLQVPLTPRK